MRPSRLALLLLAALPLATAPAQPTLAPRDTVGRDDRDFSFYDRGPYRPAVPRPEAILGYALGDWNTQYAAQERVLLAIAGAARDRVRVEQFTTSNERRSMRLFIVSSPENIARLDAIRADLDRLADPRGASEAELAAIAARTPAVVWYSGSVHGNESPGFEASMQLLYQLAASEEPATVAALRNALVIINPSSNPDGHERFSVWYNSINVANPDPQSQEHREPWSIQGRFNHYRFDMNRDLIAITQREVQGITRAMQRWHPMVTVDLHGHTPSYFFPPAARPVNQHIGSEGAKWMDIIGRANAAAFDRYGWMYFTRSDFDLYYPGYYDTWPSLTGAIGMTYETDGGGHRGIVWRRPDGTILSFRDGIAKHWVASMATLEATAARAQDRVRDYLTFRQAAVREGRTGTMKRVVIVPGKDPQRAAELVAALMRSGIEVTRASQGFSSSTARAYLTGDRGARRFDAGAYVVDMAQPQGRLARAILDPSPVMDPVFARTQLERFQRNLRRGKGADAEDYEFYDITAWALPVAFGVESWWTEDAPAVTGERLRLSADDAVLPQAQQRARAGDDVLPVDLGGGIVSQRRAQSAYLFGPERAGASRLAWQLLAEGFRVEVATEQLDAGGRRWPRGSYVVRAARNEPALHARLDQLARESAVDVVGINTAFNDEGQYGIGAGTTALRKPELAVVADEGVGQTSYGAIWWSLERRYGIRFTPIGYSYLNGGDLSKFTSIIIPPAFGLNSRISKGGVDHLKGWVRGGGTLITMGDATAWAAGEEVALTSARRVGDDDKEAKDAASPGAKDSTTRRAKDAPKDASTKADSTSRATGDQPRRDDGTPDRLAEELIPFRSPSASDAEPQPVPGAHFDVVLDRTHWLTYGYDQPRLTVMLEGDTFLKPSKEGSNVAVFAPSGTLTRAGWTWPGNTERLLRGTAMLIEERLGSGHVVLFANEPMFRGWWRALDKAVLNAALLGPAF
ncbi:MAG: M14 family zinc carboxypeptidase [Gemmatimonadaceae bacterium]